MKNNNGIIIIAIIVSVIAGFIGYHLNNYHGENAQQWAYQYNTTYNNYSSVKSNYEKLNNQVSESGEAISDVIALSKDYSSMSNLCEEKYQFALNGDFTDAFEVKGQINALQSDVSDILSKYSTAH